MLMVYKINGDSYVKAKMVPGLGFGNKENTLSDKQSLRTSLFQRPLSIYMAHLIIMFFRNNLRVRLSPIK